MQKIQIRAILEILGRPPEHIAEGLKLLAAKIKSDPGIKVLDEAHHAPVKLKDEHDVKDIYTAFMELSLEIENINALYGFFFQYMPANVEIISPEKLELTNQEMNAASNHLVQRLHQYDAIAKKMIFERDHAMNKLLEVAPHLFRQEAQPQSQQISAKVKPSEKKSKNKPAAKSKKKSK